MATIILRDKEPQVPRPFRPRAYPLYPLTTFIFGGVCVFLIYSAVVYKPVIAAIALGIALAGLPIYWLTMPWRVKEGPVDQAEAAD
jgi:amino acid transporter